VSDILSIKEGKSEMRAKKEGLKERVLTTMLKESRGSKCDIPRLSKETGIPEPTLRRYKREPEIIPLGRLTVIAKVMGSTPEEIGYVITGVRQ
jgi:hypothetical protein